MLEAFLVAYCMLRERERFVLTFSWTPIEQLQLFAVDLFSVFLIDWKFIVFSFAVVIVIVIVAVVLKIIDFYSQLSSSNCRKGSHSAFFFFVVVVVNLFFFHRLCRVRQHRYFSFLFFFFSFYHSLVKCAPWLTTVKKKR